jgi:hypothetical protein
MKIVSSFSRGVLPVIKHTAILTEIQPLKR